MGYVTLAQSGLSPEAWFDNLKAGLADLPSGMPGVSALMQIVHGIDALAPPSKKIAIVNSVQGIDAAVHVILVTIPNAFSFATAAMQSAASFQQRSMSSSMPGQPLRSPAFQQSGVATEVSRLASEIVIDLNSFYSSLAQYGNNPAAHRLLMQSLGQIIQKWNSKSRAYGPQ